MLLMISYMENTILNESKKGNTIIYNMPNKNSISNSMRYIQKEHRKSNLKSPQKSPADAKFRHRLFCIKKKS